MFAGATRLDLEVVVQVVVYAVCQLGAAAVHHERGDEVLVLLEPLHEGLPRPVVELGELSCLLYYLEGFQAPVPVLPKY